MTQAQERKRLAGLAPIGGAALVEKVQDEVTKDNKIKYFSDLAKKRKHCGGGRPKGTTKKKLAKKKK